MLFSVTHIDQAGHRHKARVSAMSCWDVMDQMDQVFGEARAMACVRMATRPVLCVVGRGGRLPAVLKGERLCAGL